MKNTTDTNVRKYNAQDLPSALTNIADLLKGKKPAIFLDYDGCLSPIVQNPKDAVLSPEMRRTLAQVAEVCPVAVVSGRDRANVADLVALDQIYYAGSHGFDISGPDNLHTEPGGAKAALQALDVAQKTLTERLKGIEGALIERKRYAIAVHFRNVPEAQVNDLLQATHDVIAQHPELKAGPGKKVMELKPNLDWHKGKAVLWLLNELDLNKPDIVPLYIGDDLTDENAFETLQQQGLGVIVGEHDEQTAATYRLEDVGEVQVFLEALRQASLS